MKRIQNASPAAPIIGGFDQPKPSRPESKSNEMTVDPKKSLSFTDIEETFDKIRQRNEEEWKEKSNDA